MSGRGFGKTLTAAQYVKKVGLEDRGVRIALIAPTFADGRDTMVEGETGLLSVLPNAALLGQSREHAWNRSVGELFLANGTRMRIFSSEQPNRLRGPQHHYAWCEEISSWNDAHKGDVVDTTWSNAKLGCRLGVMPRMVITSTPKPNKLTKLLIAIGFPAMRIVRGSSYENRANLSAAWWEQVVAPYEGTRTGRQEIMGELLEDVEGALWTRKQLDDLRIMPGEEPPFNRVVVAVDPNVSSEEAANDAGIVVVGRARVVEADRGTNLQHGYVIADRTVTSGGPRKWAQAAVDAYYEFDADRIVAEKNQGGEMVELTIRTVDPSVPYKPVSATRGKRTRAEPVASLYEGSAVMPPRVHHVGAFSLLEDEMCEWTPEAESPNRMDALVWALTELLVQQKGTGKASVSAPRGRIATTPEEVMRRTLGV